MARRDAFTGKSGLMSEAAEVPWDIQIQGRASGLWRRIESQRTTLVGKAFTKPVVQGTTRQAIGHHMAALGMPQAGGYSKADRKAPAKDKMAVAMTYMAAEAKKDASQRSDEAYMQGVAPAGQVGKWTRLVLYYAILVCSRRELMAFQPWFTELALPSAVCRYMDDVYLAMAYQDNEQLEDATNIAMHNNYYCISLPRVLLTLTHLYSTWNPKAVRGS